MGNKVSNNTKRGDEFVKQAVTAWEQDGGFTGAARYFRDAISCYQFAIKHEVKFSEQREPLQRMCDVIQQVIDYEDSLDKNEKENLENMHDSPQEVDLVLDKSSSRLYPTLPGDDPQADQAWKAILAKYHFRLSDRQNS